SNHLKLGPSPPKYLRPSPQIINLVALRHCNIHPPPLPPPQTNLVTMHAKYNIMEFWKSSEQNLLTFYNSCELFQVINAKDGMATFGIQIAFESHEKTQSNNWNQKSSSSTDTLMQDFLAQQEKIRKKYIGKSVKLIKVKSHVSKHYLSQNKSEDPIRGHDEQNYNGTFVHSLGNNSLISQKVIHRKKNPYKCLECGKHFRTSRQLTSHERIHTGEKLYNCRKYGNRFRRGTNLIFHKRIHSGEKPYKCMECGKTFAQSGTLISHIMIHTGEKPFKCMECGKTFAQKGNLMSHIMIHTGEKPFKCMECGKTFTQNGHLSSHIRIHVREKL
uniref:C2H2-type domain-containing protein n=1 Tax=Pseudonaja textilis TaxID=8673 RepID=A0A670ZSK8_PSETE